MNSFLSSVCTDMPWKPWYAMGVVVVMQRKMHTWYSVEPCDGRGEAGFLPSWLPVFEFMQLHTFWPLLGRVYLQVFLTVM